MDVSCTDLYSNRKKSVQYRGKFQPLPQYSKIFTTPIFVKLVNAECHQVWIFYTKFHQNLSRNMEITLKCSFAPFCILQHDGQFARSPPVFFYQNHLPQSEKRRSLRGLHIRCSLFYFVTNGQERSRTAAILHHCPHTHPRTRVETPTVSSPSLNLTQNELAASRLV